MTHKGWEEAGRLARLRRERLGLKQENLQLYGGPKVATVGKFERAAQDNFPLRTQHQIEKALGWSRGTIEDILQAATEDTWESMWKGDYEERLVEDDVPDLSTPTDPEIQVRRASELTDDELLAELTYRMKRYAAAAIELGSDSREPKSIPGIPRLLDVASVGWDPFTAHALGNLETRRDVEGYVAGLLQTADGAPSEAMVINVENFLGNHIDQALFAAAHHELTINAGLSEAPDTTSGLVAAHEEDGPISGETGYDDHP